MSLQTSGIDAHIHVHPAQIISHLSPWMYGSCIEDVNHEIYGGLYAQRIFGESFEEPPILHLDGWTRYGGIDPIIIECGWMKKRPIITKMSSGRSFATAKKLLTAAPVPTLLTLTVASDKYDYRDNEHSRYAKLCHWPAKCEVVDK